jgi:TRAP-type mannitol/chloroaromatic compound transport system substrate-binding protein
LIAQQNLPTLSWRLASSFPKALDKIFGAAEVFAKGVETRTNGRFSIKVHSAGELTPSFGVVDAVQESRVDMAHTFPNYFFGKDAAWGLGAGQLFGINGFANDSWLTSPIGRAEWGQFMTQQGLVSLPLGRVPGVVSATANTASTGLGTVYAWWCRKPITRFSDLRGLKVRVGGVDGRIFTQLGVVPQNIPGGEIYTALESGAIDCASWLTPYDDQKLGFYKVAPYYHYWRADAGVRAAAQTTLLISLKAWQKLPAAYQQAVEQAAKEASEWMQAGYEADNGNALKAMVASGAKLTRFPDDVQAELKRAAGAYVTESKAASPAYKLIHEAWERQRGGAK